MTPQPVSPQPATPRRATPGDAVLLARLNAHVQGWHAGRYPEAFYPDPDSEALADYFRTRLEDLDCTAFLLGEPAFAYALCQIQAREQTLFSPAVRRLIIEHIAVAPEARRQGNGGTLLRAARDLARELAVDEIMLDTWEGNADAHAFFRSEGFLPRRMLFRATP